VEGVPMSGVSTDPTRVSTGRYTVRMVMAMAGKWEIGVDWDGPVGNGSVAFEADVVGSW
jgi:hypothetical protein